MVELGIRLLIAGAVLFVAGVFGSLGFDFAWKAAAAIAAVGIFGQRLEARGMKNSGIAGFIAVADAFTIGLLLASSGKLESLGFLVLAPCAFAAARHGSQPNSMAPLAASALLVSHSIFNEGAMPGPMLLAQAAGVLAVGLLLNRSRIVVTMHRTEGQQVLAPQSDDNLLQLRESFRSLRDAYQNLERKSRRDRLAAQFDELRQHQGDRLYQQICAKLIELTGAETAALYTLAQFADSLVVRAATQEYPKSLEDTTLKIDLALAPGQIKHRIEQAMLSVKSEKDKQRIANILLIDQGHMVGMVCISHQLADFLDQAREKAEEIAPYLCTIIQADAEREAHQRRLRETELLYDLASLISGASSPSQVAARVTRELWEMLRLDHLGVFLIEGNEAILLSNEGARVRLIETMTFAGADGIEGWVRQNAPEITVFDAREDERISSEEALKRRIGSFVLIPVQLGDRPLGFVTAATHIRGGIDLPAIETLRIVATELAQALARTEGAASEAPEGVMTPREFADRVKGAAGCLIYLEPLKKDLLAESFGKPALAHALRKFVTRLRSKLPVGGCVCRRDEGDYIVFLPNEDDRFAVSWANDITASASMIGVRTPDGSARIPLAIKAKVAALGKQQDEVLGHLIA